MVSNALDVAGVNFEQDIGVPYLRMTDYDRIKINKCRHEILRTIQLPHNVTQMPFLSGLTRCGDSRPSG